MSRKVVVEDAGRDEERSFLVLSDNPLDVDVQGISSHTHTHTNE